MTQALIEAALGVASAIEEAAEPIGSGVRWPHVSRGRPASYPVDLYSGQAGVALFLAAAGAVAGEARLARLAARALDHAWELVVAESRPDCALVCGPGAVPYATLALHCWGGPVDLETAAGRCRRLAAGGNVRASELFYGAAGAGIGFLSGWRMTGKEELLDAARRCGEHLERAAIEVPEGCCWAWGGGNDDVYVGFSHGAAGICYFLVELFEATNDERWLGLASRGLEWVASWGEERFGGVVFPVFPGEKGRILTYPMFHGLGYP